MKTIGNIWKKIRFNGKFGIALNIYLILGTLVALALSVGLMRKGSDGILGLVTVLLGSLLLFLTLIFWVLSIAYSDDMSHMDEYNVVESLKKIKKSAYELELTKNDIKMLNRVMTKVENKWK